MSEITLEVNPSKNLSLSQLDEFVDAGIDRFSIGVQVNDYSYLHCLCECLLLINVGFA